MKNDRLIPGLILVLIGGVFLLHNYGYLHVHWMNFAYLWPIFLVIGGVNLILAHNRSPWATVLKIGVVIGGFALLIFGNFDNRFHFWPGTYTFNTHDDNDDDDDDTTSTSKSGIVKVEGNSFFNEPFTADARVAQLNISGGGTTYNLSDTTNQLFSANTKEFLGKYEFSHRKDDSIYVLDFNMKQNHQHHFDWGGKNNKSNEATFKLNPNPEWEINVEAGATQLNFDLSKFKIRKLKLEGGAASFEIKMGQPLATTTVEVSTGMADVNISIPKNVACRITTDSGLSSHQFDGFIKKDDDDSYETPGYANAKNKIVISIDGGVSDFKVKRY
jgi:hypothetical protein